MQRAGLAVAVANAHPWVRERAHWRTRLRGGVGAAREVCDLILAAQGKSDAELGALAVSLRTWLRDRRVLAATLAVALAAASAQLLLWWFGPAPQTARLRRPAALGLHADRCTGHANTTPRDNPSFHLQAPHLERREGDDRST